MVIWYDLIIKSDCVCKLVLKTSFRIFFWLFVYRLNFSSLNVFRHYLTTKRVSAYEILVCLVIQIHLFKVEV